MANCSSYANSWQTLKPGVDYKKISVEQEKESSKLHVLKINLKKVSIKPLYTQKPTSVKTLAKAQNALAVLNANFFDPKGKPLGLVVINKKTEHAFKNISWWPIFCIQNQKAKIFQTQTYKEGSCDHAVQAGPRLIRNGKIPKLKNQTAQKSAIGLNKNGEVFLIVSEKPVSMNAFAKTLKASEKDGGLNLTQALNLDGGSSSQMYIEIQNFRLDIINFARIPVALGVFEKS